MKNVDASAWTSTTCAEIGACRLQNQIAYTAHFALLTLVTVVAPIVALWSARSA